MCRRRILSFALLAGIGLFTGCGGTSHEQLVDQVTAVMDQFTATLGTIKDEEAAKLALPQLEEQVNRMLALVERGKKMRDPAEPLKSRLESKMKAHEKKLENQMIQFMTIALQNPAILEIVDPVFERLSKLEK